ncbi:MAG: NfeD family protein [Halioglobus sp.]
MPWWGWIFLGLFFLGSELLVVDAAFYLVFIGFAAVVVGILGVLGVAMEPSVQWMAFAGIALVSMVVFRKRLYDKLRGSGPEYAGGLAGEKIILDQTLTPGQTSRQSFRGTDWTIVNRGDKTLEANTEVEIVNTEGLTIIVS